MRIAVTGTRSGMTAYQAELLQSMLGLCGPGHDFHHGDCVGADVEAAEAARSAGMYIICHPPIKDDLRAFHASDEFRTPQSYFARNRALVDECDLLIVLPFQMSHQSSGGTWYTHDYAVRRGKNVTIIWPKETTT